LATGSITNLARVRGDHGAVASTSESFDFEVVDFAALDDGFKTVNERAIKAAIAGKNGRREIPGLRIFPRVKVTVRA
jgi:hypothetical protein